MPVMEIHGGKVAYELPGPAGGLLLDFARS